MNKLFRQIFLVALVATAAHADHSKRTSSGSLRVRAHTKGKGALRRIKEKPSTSTPKHRALDEYNDEFDTKETAKSCRDKGSSYPPTCSPTTGPPGVKDPNNPPRANYDYASTPQDTPVIVPVLDNDFDSDGHSLTISFIERNPMHGSATINADGTIRYIPESGYVGQDSFEYAISDGNGGSDTAVVTIDVLPPPNAPPQANNDPATTNQNTPVTVSVLDNDTDPDGDTLTVISVSDPPNGSAMVNADGTVTYTPDKDFVGVDTFEYTISDGNGGTDTATVAIGIAERMTYNFPPLANDDSDTTPQDTPVSVPVLDNDSDPDGDALTVASISKPPRGDAEFNPADNTIIYTPDSGFVGRDSFTYTISDGNGATDMATVTIDVTPPPNDPPRANDDSDSTLQDTPVTVPVLDNDSDPDGDPLTVTSVSNPPRGSATINRSDNTIRYTPDSGFVGQDTFTYTISDGKGGTDTATVTIDVTPPPNDPPRANDDADSTPQDTPVFVPVLDNDSDPDGDPLIVTSASNPPRGTAAINPADYTIRYTPDAGFVGQDSFTYTISDGKGGTDTATVTIDVLPPPNDPPRAYDDSDSTRQEMPVTVPVLDNDSDPNGDTLTVVSVSNPPSGSATINAPDGTITYRPDAGFVGRDSFTYTISDGKGGTDTATVTIDVTPSRTNYNNPPNAFDDSDSTPHNTPVTVSVLDNDSDPDGDSLTVISVTKPFQGGRATINADGTIRYTPDAGFAGRDTLDYTISDGKGGTDTATVTIVVRAPFPRAEDPRCEPAFAKCQDSTCFNKFGDFDSFGWSNTLNRNEAFSCPLVINAEDDCSGGTVIGRLSGTASYDASSSKAIYQFSYEVTNPDFAIESIHVYADLYEQVPTDSSGAYTVDLDAYSNSKRFDPFVTSAPGRIRVICPRDIYTVYAIFHANVCTANKDPYRRLGQQESLVLPNKEQNPKLRSTDLDGDEDEDMKILQNPIVTFD